MRISRLGKRLLDCIPSLPLIWGVDSRETAPPQEDYMSALYESSRIFVDPFEPPESRRIGSSRKGKIESKEAS